MTELEFTHNLRVKGKSSKICFMFLVIYVNTIYECTTIVTFKRWRDALATWVQGSVLTHPGYSHHHHHCHVVGHKDCQNSGSQLSEL